MWRSIVFMWMSWLRGIQCSTEKAKTRQWRRQRQRQWRPQWRQRQRQQRQQQWQQRQLHRHRLNQKQPQEKKLCDGLSAVAFACRRCVTGVQVTSKKSFITTPWCLCLVAPSLSCRPLPSCSALASCCPWLDLVPWIHEWARKKNCRGRAQVGVEEQTQDKVFWQDIPGTSGTHTSGCPGQKLYHQHQNVCAIQKKSC